VEELSDITPIGARKVFDIMFAQLRDLEVWLLGVLGVGWFNEWLWEAVLAIIEALLGDPKAGWVCDMREAMLTRV
jgi:hypothetical protein